MADECSRTSVPTPASSGRPPGDRALRGAAGRRRRARQPDRHGEGPVGLRRHPGAGQRRGAGAGRRSEAAPSDSFALATAAADLAELVKLGGYDADHESDNPTGRTTSYAGIRTRVEALVARSVPGAADLLALVDGCERGSRGN